MTLFLTDLQDLCEQVPVSCHDHAHIRFQGLTRTDTFELSFLQDTQESNLC